MSAAKVEDVNPAPVNGAELLARIQPTMRRVTTYLCLRPDLLDAWADANDELAALRKESVDTAGPGRLAAGAKKRVTAAEKKKAEEIQELEQQIEATQVRFVLEKMDTPTWTALTAQHPPREGNMVDHVVGHNRDAVANEGVRICLIDPVFDDKSYPELLKSLGPSEWDELKDAFESANGKVVQAPKSALAEATLLDAKSRTSSRPRRTGG